MAYFSFWNLKGERKGIGGQRAEYTLLDARVGLAQADNLKEEIRAGYARKRIIDACRKPMGGRIRRCQEQ